MICAGFALENLQTGGKYQELENLVGNNMDPIADMLTSIRNASAVKHESLLVPYSKVKFGILKIMKKESWIGDIEIKHRGEKQLIAINLRYDLDGKPAIDAIRRVSKPGRRMYVGWKEILPIRQGYGISILSTPAGIVTGKEARAKKVGGEILCQIW